jgi:hypothetical protein
MLAAEILLGHFWAMAIFALLLSVAMAAVGRQTLSGRIKYAVLSFAILMIVSIGIAWLMYPLSR